MSKTNKKIRKALKKINKQNGGQKMTAKANKQKLNGENAMKNSIENKSFTIAGSNVRIEYKWVNPKMAANMLENNYEGTEGVDPHLQSQCEKAIEAGRVKDENTDFIVNVGEDNLYLDGDYIFAAIVEMDEPAVVAFASNLPEETFVVYDYDKTQKERYSLIANAVLEIKNKMEHLLSEFCHIEINKQPMDQIESNLIYPHLSFLSAHFMFPTWRKYAKKVYQYQDNIRTNTIGVALEWFAVCWMLAETNGKENQFFHAIAYNKPELCPDAKSYIESSRYWLENYGQVSDGSFISAKAAQKIELKCYAEKAVLKEKSAIRKAS